MAANDACSQGKKHCPLWLSFGRSRASSCLGNKIFPQRAMYSFRTNKFYLWPGWRTNKKEELGVKEQCQRFGLFLLALSEPPEASREFPRFKALTMKQESSVFESESDQGKEWLKKHVGD